MKLTKRELLHRSSTLAALAPFISYSALSSALAQESTTSAQSEDLPESVSLLLDPVMSSRLLRVKDVGQDTYYAIAQYDELGSGEPVFIRQPGDGEPVIVEEVSSLPLAMFIGSGGDAAPGSSEVDFDISLYQVSELDLVPYFPEGDAAPRPELDNKLHQVCQNSVGLSSKEASGTNKGKLACAWAVNRITRAALGREIGGGLATANMIKVLKSRHLPIKQASAPAGSIVISPTETTKGRRNIGHVGIIGEQGRVYSNSSRNARWEQNFTLGSWKEYYVGKGLTMQIYRLDADYFP